MSRHRISMFAICPYYKHEDTQMVYCESCIPGTVIHLAFVSKTNARDYKVDMCQKDYKSCKIYQMLEKEAENEK